MLPLLPPHAIDDTKHDSNSWPTVLGAQGALTIIPWVVLASVIAVVLAIRGPRLYPLFGVFERLFYLSSIPWVLIIAIDLAGFLGEAASNRHLSPLRTTAIEGDPECRL